MPASRVSIAHSRSSRDITASISVSEQVPGLQPPPRRLPPRTLRLWRCGTVRSGARSAGCLGDAQVCRQQRAPKLALQQAQDRVPMGCHPPRVRQRQRVLPAVPAVASGGRVPHDARGDGPLLRPACWRRPELVLARQRHCQGTKRGDLTGPSPTDRAKLGTKRHILTDADGVPLAVTITGANVHDKWMVGQTLDAMVLRGPRGPRRPKNLCLDKGYDYADCEQEVRRRRIVPHIRRRGEPTTGRLCSR